MCPPLAFTTPLCLCGMAWTRRLRVVLVVLRPPKRGRSSCRDLPVWLSAAHLVEPPLQLIPKELSEILMWTERERGQGMVRMSWYWRKSCVTLTWCGCALSLPQMVFPWRRKNDGMVLVYEHLVNTLLQHFLFLGQCLSTSSLLCGFSHSMSQIMCFNKRKAYTYLHLGQIRTRHYK